jgi:hypothetical protein
MTVSAAVKFNPNPPARVDKRNMKISGSELKSSICKKNLSVTLLFIIQQRLIQKKTGMDDTHNLIHRRPQLHA